MPTNDVEFEFEVNSPFNDPQLFYFDSIEEGVKYLNREFGTEWDKGMQWVITQLYKRAK